MGGLATVVAPQISNIGKSQRVNETAFAIKEKLIEAQAFAKAPPQDNNSADAYGIIINTSNTQIYRHFPTNADCGSDGVGDGNITGTICSYSPRPIKLDRVKMETGAGLSYPAGVSYIWFTVGGKVLLNYTDISDITPPNQNNIIKDPLDDVFITVNNLEGTEKRQITINRLTGAINITQP